MLQQINYNQQVHACVPAAPQAQPDGPAGPPDAEKLDLQRTGGVVCGGRWVCVVGGLQPGSQAQRTDKWAGWVGRQRDPCWLAVKQQYPPPPNTPPYAIHRLRLCSQHCCGVPTHASLPGDVTSFPHPVPLAMPLVVFTQLCC
jgi:hypothetical protein